MLHSGAQRKRGGGLRRALSVGADFSLWARHVLRSITRAEMLRGRSSSRCTAIQLGRSSKSGVTATSFRRVGRSFSRGTQSASSSAGRASARAVTLRTISRSPRVVARSSAPPGVRRSRREAGRARHREHAPGGAAEHGQAGIRRDVGGVEDDSWPSPTPTAMKSTTRRGVSSKLTRLPNAPPTMKPSARGLRIDAREVPGRGEHEKNRAELDEQVYLKRVRAEG